MLSYGLDDKSSLQLLEPRHAEELFALVDANRGRLRNWLRWVDNTRSAGDTRAFIEKALQDLADDDGLVLGIWCETSLAGVIGVRHRPIDRFAEIGYWLGAAYEGRGLMTKSVVALLPYLFEARDLNRVEIRCAPENVRSCHVPERLGFQLEGVLRQTERLPDRFVDNRVYGLLREEWRQRG